MKLMKLAACFGFALIQISGLSLCQAAQDPASATAPASRTSPEFEAQIAQQGWSYGWTHGVDKVFRKDRPFGGSLGGTLKVELAANEYEGVQLVLRSRVALKNVRVSVTDLATGDGLKIPANQIEVLPVGYVNTKKPPYPVDYVGWWPDPLLNFLPAFDIEADAWQPVWLDVHTSPDQPSGSYKGEVTVTADGAKPLKALIEVEVWNFAVPKDYHLPLSLSLRERSFMFYSKDQEQWNKFTDYVHDKATLESLGSGEARRLVDIRRKCQEMLWAHHLTPDDMYRSEPPRIDELKAWKEHGGARFNIMQLPRTKALKVGDPYPADLKKRVLDVLDDFVPKLQKEGLLDIVYIYGFDEVKAEKFAAMKDIFGELKNRYPKIPIMTTAQDETYGLDTGLDECVDIWVPLTRRYAVTGPGIEAARKRGKQVWYYVCDETRHPRANIFVDYTAAEHRLLVGFMPWKVGSQGFLYYSLNFWATNRLEVQPDGSKKTNWNVPFSEPLNRGPLTNSDGKSWGDCNGDGLLFYPGPDGPVSTIRMKCLRDGLEDYEYLWLLKQRYDQVKSGKRKVSDEWLKRAEAALVVDDALVKSLTQFSREGSDVLAARRTIAKLLIEAN